MRELGYRSNSVTRASEDGEFRTIGVILFTFSTIGNSRPPEGDVDQPTLTWTKCVTTGSMTRQRLLQPP
ncbi:hypothetical protein [Saccharothrix deserti]|uniref:hypothetical protein n=1 Tax=Saccharothrix deserti TaxID=2593674 RepID=UPI00192E7494|nr:hypothetical protein [Saccharothrix deserti]